MNAPHRARRGVRALVAGAVLAVTLSACTSVRNDLGTSDSLCYIALPSAASAVHNQGHLIGVHLVRLATILSDIPRFYRSLPSSARDLQRMCLVAFGGSFDASAVTDPHGHSEGHLALVLLSYPENKVLATFLFAHLPLRFAHSHLFS